METHTIGWARGWHVRSLKQTKLVHVLTAPHSFTLFIKSVRLTGTAYLQLSLHIKLSKKCLPVKHWQHFTGKRHERSIRKHNSITACVSARCQWDSWRHTASRRDSHSELWKCGRSAEERHSHWANSYFPCAPEISPLWDACLQTLTYGHRRALNTSSHADMIEVLQMAWRSRIRTAVILQLSTFLK